VLLSKVALKVLVASYIKIMSRQNVKNAGRKLKAKKCDIISAISSFKSEFCDGDKNFILPAFKASVYDNISIALKGIQDRKAVYLYIKYHIEELVSLFGYKYTR
jgi:hypothetical protein